MSRIISIHSFRGGTGKSNLTANLAATMASQGKRVGIVDTDIQSPGVHVIFGLDENTIGKTLNDYLWGRCTIEQCAYDVSGVMREVPPEFITPGGAIFLIPSSLKTGEITRILSEGYEVSLLNDGFQELLRRLKLDFLFIDTHPGVNEETLLSIAISDALIIILRPDRQDYQGTAVTVDVARKLNVPQMMLVVNKALPSFDFDALEKLVEETFNVSVGAILPLSEEMIRLGSSAVFSLRFPTHPFTEKLRAIAGLVSG
jgi:MinD-like ATPase involved in chromosome partitioning or flagellar assembly